MSFGNFLKTLAPMAATALGGPVVGALVGGGLGWLGSRGQAAGQQAAGQQAANTANQGYNYLSGSPVGQQYLPAGGAAIDQQQALLGLGGDPAAAAEAFRNYQNSTGFQGQMEAGQDAITGSAAARGLLGSGSTAKALQAHGQQLGAQSFNNYLGQLGGVANMGLQAGGMVGQAAASGGLAGANAQYGAGMAATDTRARGWDQLAAGVGGALDAWGAGRQGGSGVMQKRKMPASVPAPRGFA